MDADRTTSRAPSGRRRTRLAALGAAALAALAVLAAACGGSGADLTAPVESTPPSAVAGTPAGSDATTSAALVGSWRRLLYFTDGPVLRASVTTWTFDANGGAVRVVSAQNLTDGVADAVVSAGTYTAAGSTLTIRLATPDTGTTSYAYRIVTTATSAVPTLYLDSTAYAQVTQATEVGF